MRAKPANLAAGIDHTVSPTAFSTTFAECSVVKEYFALHSINSNLQSYHYPR